MPLFKAMARDKSKNKAEQAVAMGFDIRRGEKSAYSAKSNGKAAGFRSAGKSKSPYKTDKGGSGAKRTSHPADAGRVKNVRVKKKGVQSSAEGGSMTRNAGRENRNIGAKAARNDDNRRANNTSALKSRKRRERDKITYNDGYAGFEQEFEPVSEKRRPLSPAKRRFLKVMTLIFLVVAFLVVGVVLSCTVFFNTEHINVILPKGFDKYTKQQIIDESGLKTGENLFLSDKSGAAEKIEAAFPYIKSAKVSISLPDTLDVKITSTVPKYYVQTSKGCVVLGDGNKILEISKKNDKINAPLLKGVTLEAGNVGEYAVIKDKNAKNVLSGILSALEKCELGNMTAIDMSLMSNITLVYEGRIKIVLGAYEDIEYKLKTAKTIINEKLTEDDTGTLDVSLCAGDKKQSSFLPSEIEESTSKSNAPDKTSSDTDSETSDSDSSDTDDISTDAYSGDDYAGDGDNTGDDYSYGGDDGSYNDDYGYDGDDGSYNDDYSYDGDDGSYGDDYSYDGDDGSYGDDYYEGDNYGDAGDGTY